MVYNIRNIDKIWGGGGEGEERRQKRRNTGKGEGIEEEKGRRG
jgi:hypothetical protein